MSFENKVALLTGALGGIGQELVRVLLENKAKVTLIDIAPNGGQIVAKFAENFGKENVLYVQADVSNSTQFEAAFQKTVDTFKHLDIVINNAGIGNENDPQQIGSVNLTGTLIGTSLAFECYLPKYKTSEEGVVINIASLSGLMPFAGAPLYSATKFGVVALGRNFGHEFHYNSTKVRILTICPGFTDTPLTNPECNSQSLSKRFGLFTKAIMDSKIKQPVSAVGKMFLRAFNEGSTGSVWIISDEKAGEVDFPAFTMK